MTLRVGETGQSFNVHESLLKHSSPFFGPALYKKWKEGGGLGISLPDDETPIVAGYLEWLYYRRINTEQAEDGQPMWLAKAYIFGDKVQDDDFCSAVVSVMAAWIQDKVDGKSFYSMRPEIDLIYSRTHKNSPIRKMLISMFGARATPEIVLVAVP